MIKNKWIFLISIVLAIGLYCYVNKISFADGANNKFIELKVYNPYKISVELETKCNWDWKKREYKFYKIIKIKGKSNVVIKVPGGLTECEIWAGNVSLF